MNQISRNPQHAAYQSLTLDISCKSPETNHHKPLHVQLKAAAAAVASISHANPNTSRLQTSASRRDVCEFSPRSRSGDISLRTGWLLNNERNPKNFCEGISSLKECHLASDWLWQEFTSTVRRFVTQVRGDGNRYDALRQNWKQQKKKKQMQVLNYGFVFFLTRLTLIFTV